MTNVLAYVWPGWLASERLSGGGDNVAFPHDGVRRAGKQRTWERRLIYAYSPCRHVLDRGQAPGLRLASVI